MTSVNPVIEAKLALLPPALRDKIRSYEQPINNLDDLIAILERIVAEEEQ